MGTELKPCPFCGENKHEYYVEEEPMGLRIRGDAFKQKLNFECWVVECLTCDTSGPGDISERLAIKKWNIRSETAQLEARVRDLEAGIRKFQDFADENHDRLIIIDAALRIDDSTVTKESNEAMKRSKFKSHKIMKEIEQLLNPPESGEA